MVKTQDLSQTKAKGKIRFSFLFEIKLIPKVESFQLKN